jgi:hypothetical protein
MATGTRVSGMDRVRQALPGKAPSGARSLTPAYVPGPPRATHLRGTNAREGVPGSPIQRAFSRVETIGPRADGG